MDNKERATVMLLHGSDKLRQVIAQGLVSKDVQQDIEETLAAAEDARIYAETMQRQADKQASMARTLEAEIKDLRKRGEEDARYYARAVEAYKREEKRRKENADKKETFCIAVFGAVAFIIANMIGRLVFGILIK